MLRASTFLLLLLLCLPAVTGNDGDQTQRKPTPLVGSPPPLPGSFSGVDGCTSGICYTYFDAFASPIKLNVTSNMWLYPYENTIMLPLYHRPSNTLRYLLTPKEQGSVLVATFTDPTFSASPVTAELQALPEVAAYDFKFFPYPIACLTRSGDGFLMFWALANDLSSEPLRLLRYTFDTNRLEYSDPLAAVLGPRSRFPAPWIPPSVCIVLHPEYDDVVVAMVFEHVDLVGQTLFVLRVPDGVLLSQHTFIASPNYSTIQPVSSSYLTLLRGQYYIMAPGAGLVSFTLPGIANASITPAVFPDIWDRSFDLPSNDENGWGGLSLQNTWADEQGGVVLCLANPVFFPPLHPNPVSEWRVYVYNVSSPNISRWINSWHRSPVYANTWPQGNAVFYTPLL